MTFQPCTLFEWSMNQGPEISVQNLANRPAVSIVPLSEAQGGGGRLECTSAAVPEADASTASTAAVLCDEDLFLRVRAGDRESLAILVGRYEARLFALLVRMTGGDTHRADDLFQETFLRAVRAAATFNGSRRFRPWLTTIAVNLVRDEARKRKLHGEVGLESPDADLRRSLPAAPGETPEESATRGDEAAKVNRALAGLSEKEREVVLLHFYDGLTLAEAAQALEIPLGTIKSRLHGALVRLRELLG